jgi:hypothetical protein
MSARKTVALNVFGTAARGFERSAQILEHLFELPCSSTFGKLARFQI